MSEEQDHLSPLMGQIFTQMIADEQHTANALRDTYLAMRDDMARELIEVMDELAAIPDYARSITIESILVRSSWAYDAAKRYLEGEGAR